MKSVLFPFFVDTYCFNNFLVAHTRRAYDKGMEKEFWKLVIHTVSCQVHSNNFLV